MFMINIANIFNWTPLLLVNGIFNYIRSAIILLLPPKYEIIMVPSNRSSFQYCDSNIGLFSIAPCKVVTLDPLCILFGISSLPGSLLLF